MALVGRVPQVSRPLKVFDDDRRKKILQLANLVIQIDGTDAGARTVRYLLEISNRRPTQEPLPVLPWVSTRSHGEFDALVNLDLGSHSIGMVIPQMAFQARFNRRR